MTRPRADHIKVFVTEEERAKIEQRAKSANLSLSAYLRAAGLNHPVRSMMDIEAVMAMAKLHGELGMIANGIRIMDEALKSEERGAYLRAKRKHLDECYELQKKIHQIMGKAVR